MDLKEQFYQYLLSQGLTDRDIYTERNNGFTLISFNRPGDNKCLYNIAVLLYDDNIMTEILVRKEIDVNNVLPVLKALNFLNADYRGVSFFIVDGCLLTVKSYCEPAGKVSAVVDNMLNTMKVAYAEFPEFKPKGYSSQNSVFEMEQKAEEKELEQEELIYEKVEKEYNKEVSRESK